MILAIGSDHAGFALKSELVARAAGDKDFQGVQILDLGTKGSESVDYPDFADPVARAVLRGRAQFGVLICGSGQGMCMRANRHPGIRAALCFDPSSAALAREHNDANVLCLGARKIDPAEAMNVLRLFLQTTFAGGRHLPRVKKLDRSPDENEDTQI